MANNEVSARVPDGWLCLEPGENDLNKVHDGICAHLEELNNARDEDGNPYDFEPRDCTITILVYDASLPLVPNLGKPKEEPVARLLIPPIPHDDELANCPDCNPKGYTHRHRPNTPGYNKNTRIDGLKLSCPDGVPSRWNETRKIVNSMFNQISKQEIKNAKKRQGITEEGKQPVFMSYLQLECKDDNGRTARSTVTKNPVIKFPNDSTINERPKL